MPNITSSGASGAALPPAAYLRNDGVYAPVPVLARTAEPAGAAGVTFPRSLASSSTAALTSGTVYACAISLDQGMEVTNIGLFVAGTAESGGTHAWVGLADNQMNVLAVSADKTSATYFSGTQTAVVTPLAAPFITAYAGLYYVFVMVAMSAGATPVFASAVAAENAALSALAPVLCGSSSTSQTTPPAAGTALTALTATAGHLFYAWLT